jgi:hypothetical protein
MEMLSKLVVETDDKELYTNLINYEHTPGQKQFTPTDLESIDNFLDKLAIQKRDVLQLVWNAFPEAKKRIFQDYPNTSTAPN